MLSSEFSTWTLTTSLVATADFVYVRFHGSTSLHGGCYSDGELPQSLTVTFRAPYEVGKDSNASHVSPPGNNLS